MAESDDWINILLPDSNISDKEIENMFNNINDLYTNHHHANNLLLNDTTDTQSLMLDCEIPNLIQVYETEKVLEILEPNKYEKKLQIIKPFVSKENSHQLTDNVSQNENFSLIDKAANENLFNGRISNYSFDINSANPLLSSTPFIKTISDYADVNDSYLNNKLLRNDLSNENNKALDNKAFQDSKPICEYEEIICINNATILGNNLKPNLKPNIGLDDHKLQSTLLRYRLENILKDSNDIQYETSISSKFNNRENTDIKLNKIKNEEIVDINKLPIENVKNNNDENNTTLNLKLLAHSSTDLKNKVDPEFEKPKDSYRSLSDSDRYDLPLSLKCTNTLLFKTNDKKSNSDFKIFPNLNKCNDSIVNPNSSNDLLINSFELDLNSTLKSDDALDSTRDSLPLNSKTSRIEDVHEDDGSSTQSDNFITNTKLSTQYKSTKNSRRIKKKHTVADAYVDLPLVKDDVDNFNEPSVTYFETFDSSKYSKKVLIPYKPQGTGVLYYIESELASFEDTKNTTMESSHLGSDDRKAPLFVFDVVASGGKQSFNNESSHCSQIASTDTNSNSDIELRKSVKPDYMIIKHASNSVSNINASLDSKGKVMSNFVENPKLMKNNINMFSNNQSSQLINNQRISIAEALEMFDKNIRDNKALWSDIKESGDKNEELPQRHVSNLKKKLDDQNLTPVSDMAEKNCNMNNNKINYYLETKRRDLSLKKSTDGKNSIAETDESNAATKESTSRKSDIASSVSSVKDLNHDASSALNRLSIDSALMILQKKLTRQMDKYKQMRKQEKLWRARIDELQQLLRQNPASVNSSNMSDVLTDVTDSSSETCTSSINAQLKEANSQLESCITEAKNQKRLICNCLHSNGYCATKCSCGASYDGLTDSKDYYMNQLKESAYVLSKKNRHVYQEKENLSSNILAFQNFSRASQTTPRLQELRDLNHINNHQQMDGKNLSNRNNGNSVTISRRSNSDQRYSFGSKKSSTVLTGSNSWFVELTPRNKSNFDEFQINEFVNINMAPSLQDAFEKKMHWFKEKSKYRLQSIERQRFLRQPASFKSQIKPRYNEKLKNSSSLKQKAIKLETVHAMQLYKKKEAMLNKEKLKVYSQKVLKQVLNRK